MEPIYVVSGFPRSGTSMMMRCLEAGGLPCVYSREGDANRNKNTLIPGYVPNPHGFYEGADLQSKDWSGFRGKAVKVLSDNLSFIPPGETLKVVYMLRDPEEIKRSYVGIMSGPHPEPFGWLEGYHRKKLVDVSRLWRNGHRVKVLMYSEVVSHPVECLSYLGWPIDVEKAAAAVDPALYRHQGAA